MDVDVWEWECVKCHYGGLVSVLPNQGHDEALARAREAHATDPAEACDGDISVVFGRELRDQPDAGGEHRRGAERWSQQWLSKPEQNQIEDLRAQLAQRTAERDKAQERLRGWDYVKGRIDDTIMKHARSEHDEADREMNEMNRQAWHDVITLAIEKLSARAEAAEKERDEALANYVNPPYSRGLAALCSRIRSMAVAAMEREQQLEAAEARVRALEEAVRAFLDKWPSVEAAVNAVLGLQAARGYPYTGPNIGAEVEQLQKVLPVRREPERDTQPPERGSSDEG
jgi:hypothetical protein